MRKPLKFEMLLTVRKIFFFSNFMSITDFSLKPVRIQQRTNEQIGREKGKLISQNPNLIQLEEVFFFMVSVCYLVQRLLCLIFYSPLFFSIEQSVSTIVGFYIGAHKMLHKFLHFSRGK